MPNFGMLPQQQVLVATATQTTTGVTAAMSISPASAYRFMVGMLTVSGTSPTLQVSIATSFDNGTTYHEVMTTAQMTTSGAGYQIIFRPYLSGGDLATSAALGNISLATPVHLGTSAVLNNGPINPQFVKIGWIVGGTTPSFSFNVGLLALPQDLSD